jgi:hypothetical protein
MRRSLLALLLLTACSFAQQPTANGRNSAHLPPVPNVTTQMTERLVPVTHSDLYCAGFLAKDPGSKGTYIVGGLNSPNQTRFHTGDFVFLHGNYELNSRVSFVRQTQDINRWDAYEGQAKTLKRAGDIFADLGYAVVVEKRGTDTVVAQVEFSCDAIVPGDFVVPFAVRPELSYRAHTTIDQFPQPAEAVGRIIAARDFDQYVGAGRKVYIDLGSKTAKAGDMFLVTRSYEKSEMDDVDRYELKTATIEETRKNAEKLPKDYLKQMPHHTVAEVVVLSTHDRIATAMITFSTSEVHVGDSIFAEPANVAMQNGPRAEVK